MATNPYINWNDQTNEQNLIQDIITESIQFSGIDVVYLPRRNGNEDDFYNQDNLSFFDTTYDIEMYLVNIDSYGGEGSFLTKFGLEVRDRINLDISTARFKELIGDIENMPRPNEGDLLWFPMGKRMFEIKWVDTKASFYPLGSLPLIQITCELFEYNNERFTTNNPDIDELQTKYSSDKVQYYEKDSNGDYVYDGSGNHILDSIFEPDVIDPEYDNEFLQNESSENIFDDINLNVTDPFADV